MQPTRRVKIITYAAYFIAIFLAAGFIISLYRPETVRLSVSIGIVIVGVVLTLATVFWMHTTLVEKEGMDGWILFLFMIICSFGITAAKVYLSPIIINWLLTP